MAKSEAVAAIIDMLVDELVCRCRREDGIHDYFDVAILGYSGNGVVPLLGNGEFAGVADIVKSPVPVRRISVRRTMPDGRQMPAFVERHRWIEGRASGATPMCAALEEAGRMVARWCVTAANRNSYPPVVMNITDGEASDAGDGELLAAGGRIRDCATADGNVLLFNIHLAGGDPAPSPVCFPSSRGEVPSLPHAGLLYDMSSVVPSCYDELVRESHPASLPPFRAIGYNCTMDELFGMLAIGTASSSFTL